MGNETQERPTSPTLPLFAVIFAGPEARDPRSSLRNLSFASSVAVAAWDPEVARAYREAGAGTVLEVPPAAGGELRPAALPRGLLESLGDGWLLILNGAERVSLELRDEILQDLPRASKETAAFSVEVTRHLHGKYLRHGGWRQRETRIFRLGGDGEANTPGNGHAGALGHLLVSLGDRKISESVARLNRVSGLVGERQGNIRPWRILAEPMGLFLKRFVLRQGFRDGFAGFVAAALDAMLRLALLAKGWECDLERRTAEQSPGTQPRKRPRGDGEAIADIYRGNDLNHEGHEEHEGEKG